MINSTSIVVKSEIFFTENPKFTAPITNVTVPVGREAILTCLVEDLGQYKVSRNHVQ